MSNCQTDYMERITYTRSKLFKKNSMEMARICTDYYSQGGKKPSQKPEKLPFQLIFFFGSTKSNHYKEEEGI